MKPTINLYLDFEFTSLSPDAQPISLGIVSDEFAQKIRLVPEGMQHSGESMSDFAKRTYDEKLGDEITQEGSKSFYAEFTDFDIERCDDWVKENVVSKLNKYTGDGNYCRGDMKAIRDYLKEWLSQFSDYDIQIVVDCGTWDWYHFLQLVAEWVVQKEDVTSELADPLIHGAFEAHALDVLLLTKAKGRNIKIVYQGLITKQAFISNRTGLPKLPSNISPVPLDLNDLIAHKKGINVKMAFDMNREEILIDNVWGMTINEKSTLNGEPMQKHNALWDAKVIKAIYQKLI